MVENVENSTLCGIENHDLHVHSTEMPTPRAKKCNELRAMEKQIEWKMRMTRKQYWNLDLHISRLPFLHIASVYLSRMLYLPACHLQASAYNFYLPPKSIPLWWFITTTAPCSRPIFSMPRTSNETPSNLSTHRHPIAGNLESRKRDKNETRDRERVWEISGRCLKWFVREFEICWISNLCNGYLKLNYLYLSFVSFIFN